jgi:hypothetical protein
MNDNKKKKERKGDRDATWRELTAPRWRESRSLRLERCREASLAEKTRREKARGASDATSRSLIAFHISDLCYSLLLVLVLVLV